MVTIHEDTTNDSEQQFGEFEDFGMPILAEDVEHGAVTTRSVYRYLFTTKHHGAVKEAAQWMPSLSLDEEFAVFDIADQHSLADAKGDLYGIMRIDDDDLLVLGTRGEQVAKFPVAAPNDAWHGYPAWALAGGNRGRDDMKPPKAVLDAMLDAGLITKRGRRRLGKGDPV